MIDSPEHVSAAMIGTDEEGCGRITRCLEVLSVVSMVLGILAACSLVVLGLIAMDNTTAISSSTYVGCIVFLPLSVLALVFGTLGRYTVFGTFAKIGQFLGLLGFLISIVMLGALLKALYAIPVTPVLGSTLVSSSVTSPTTPGHSVTVTYH